MSQGNQNAFKTWDEQTDVIIVGAGGAGLSAAIESANARSDTIVFEKLGTSKASSTAISGGIFSFAGTDFQATHPKKGKRAPDSEELLYKDIMNAGQWKNDPKLVDVYIKNQIDTYRWLTGLGVKWNSILSGAGMSVPRGHRTHPVHLIETLKQAAKISGAKVIYRAPTTCLITNEEQKVTGVCVERRNETIRVRAKKGVVLATGGFGRNPARLEAIAPGLGEVAIVVGTGHTGDGHRMAEELGAYFKDNEYVKPTFGIHASSKSLVTIALLIYAGAILVNRRGERFINESMGYKDIGMAVLGQPGSVGFQVFDEKIYSNVMTKGGFVAVRLDKISALSVKAGTIEELASKIGVPPEALKETVQRYNSHADKGKDQDFGRTTKVGGIGTIASIDSPPFYAYESKGMLPGTYAGIVVDEHMRVLSAEGIVKGLYAAGELVGGFHGASYMTGTALAKAIIFGRIAGRHAASANIDDANSLTE